jgi:hypothetical protein
LVLALLEYALWVVAGLWVALFAPSVWAKAIAFVLIALTCLRAATDKDAGSQAPLPGDPSREGTALPTAPSLPAEKPSRPRKRVV